MAWLGNFFGGAGGNNGGGEFVGQYVDLGKQKLRIKRVVAEGGFGFVFVAQDIATNKEYALKRLMAADDATSKLIVKEVSFLRKLRGHPNIVQYIGAASGEENRDHSMKEYLILTELCTGQLVDYMKAQGVEPLPFAQVLKIFAQCCRAVIHMHKQSPPIIHRDLKIENMLFSSKGVIKICDFGSATTEAIYPDDSWSALQRSMAEEEIQQNTTPMYRAPEMIDLYSNYSVTVQADVWALGCILYFLCFNQHPFEDSAKLKIMNANYTIPETDQMFQDFHQLINSMLKVNPDERANVEDIYAELIAISTEKSIDLKAPIIETTTAGSVVADAEHAALSGVGTNYGSSVLLGSVVSKAGSLFSNIKDVSSKVMSTMAGYAKSDMDISYITSRLLDGIEGTFKNNIDDVRLFMDSKHPEGYVVINISQRTYRTAKLNDRVYDSGWNPKRSPSLEKLVSLCRKLNNFLKQNKKNVVVVHCLDGKVASSLLLCSFFLFCKLFTKVSMAIHLFNLKRCSVEEPVVLTPSQKRYINYVGQLVNPSRSIPHNNIVFLKSFSISPIPVFNKAKTGCRPFIEIYENEKRILNTAKEIDEMREYSIEDGKIVFQTHIRLHGDITLLVHHGRSTLGGKVQGKLTSINIFSLQFYTGFLKKDSPNAVFSLNELDLHETSDKYPPNFGVCLNVKFTDETPEKMCTMPWEKMHVEKLSPYVCFSSREEYWLIHEEYGLSEEKTPVQNQNSISSEPENPSVESSPKNDQNALFDLDDDDDDKTQEKGSTPLFETNPVAAGTPSIFVDLHGEAPAPVTFQQAPAASSQTFQDLIDISPPSHTSPDIVNSDDFSAFSEPLSSGDFSSGDFGVGGTNANSLNGDLNHIELIDPFASLATSRTNKSTGDEPSSNDILLNLDQSTAPIEGLTKSNSFTTGFDLINSVNESTGKHSSPDILPNVLSTSQNDFVPIKRNKSVDDINCDELLGDHNELKGINIERPKQAVDPFMKHFHNSPRKSNSESNLLGDWGDGGLSGTATLTPEIHQAGGSTASLNKAPVYDPFSEFGNLNTGDKFGSGKGFAKAGSGPMNSSMNSMNGLSNNNNNPSSRISPTPFAASAQPSTNNHQPKPQVSPNYNVFITPSESGAFSVKPGVQKPGWAPKPVNRNEFNDLLDAQGFVKSTPADPQKNTLKELRNSQEDQNDDDPIKRKIRDWSDGKERNIRALLTSLQSVLWENEGKWTPIGIHQIMQASDVKKYYRKACLSVHPDKHTGLPHEELARAIFIELNVSWSLFEESGALSL